MPRTLARLDASTCLRGSFVEATLQPGDPDADTPAGDVCSPTRSFGAVTRSNGRFEALMAYFHIDRAQSYVQSLGFPNVLNSRIRANVDAPIPGPSTEDGQDNSYFDPLTGQLTFGTGWADDAEDGETIAHEYGHAIQDAQIPGFPLTDSAAAIGEGWGDYLASALSATYAPRAGFEGCFDEWDAFASGLGNCLRRVDWNLRPGQVSSDCTDAADEHCARRGLVRRALGGSLGARRPDRGPARAAVALQPDRRRGLRGRRRARCSPRTRRCTAACTVRWWAPSWERAGSWTPSASTTRRPTPARSASPRA